MCRLLRRRRWWGLVHVREAVGVLALLVCALPLFFLGLWCCSSFLGLR
jgi:hypothetical protein